MLGTKETFFFWYAPLILAEFRNIIFLCNLQRKKSMNTVCKKFHGFFVLSIHEKLDTWWHCLLDVVYFLEYINFMTKNVICKWLPSKNVLNFFFNLCWVILVKLFFAKDQFVDEKLPIIIVLDPVPKMVI